MRLIQINDPHVCDRPPAWRTDTYLDDVFIKLEWSLAQPCDAVLIPGDLFHNPAPTRVSHFLVQRWLRLLDRGTSPVLVVAGNHDLSAGRSDSILRQPLGVVCTHPRVMLLDGSGYDFPDSTRLQGWGWGADVHDIRNGCAVRGADIVMLHAPLSPAQLPYGERMDPLELSGCAPIVVYGHMHGPLEPYRAGETLFVNPGALARGALTPEDVDRTPQIAVIDITAGTLRSVEYVPVEVARPGSTVFRIEAATTRRSDDEAVARFVEVLGSASVESVTPESLMEQITMIAGDAVVAERARAILAEVS